jgi:hypothetical protein
MSLNPIRVFLEIGQTRTFAVVPHWPGWCRSGGSEDAALRALLEYAPRYAQALAGSGLAFPDALSLTDLQVEGKVVGNATTDFGAPAMPLPPDDLLVSEDELAYMQVLLAASWAAFDRAAQAAEGKSMRTGPRGGGRDLAKMVAHVGEAELAYLSKLGGKMPLDSRDDQTRRRVMLETLAASVRGGIPAVGPRGGGRWTPRFFVRRTAWHTLDHAWEIEDRIE